MRPSASAILVFSIIVLAACSGRSAPGAAEAEIKTLEERWTKAEAVRDVATVRAMLAADFIYVGPDGAAMNAEEDLAGIADEKFRVGAYSMTDLRVRVYGDSALSTGIEVLVGAFFGDRDMSGRYRVTTVWVKRDGAWQAVHTQETRIAVE